MPRTRALTKETLALARRLREQEGKTFDEIAQITGISKPTISRAAKRDKWKDNVSDLVRDNKKNVSSVVRHIKPESGIRSQIENMSDDQKKNLIDQMNKLVDDPKEFAKKGMIAAATMALQQATTGDTKAIAVAGKIFSNMAQLTDAFTTTETERRLTVMVPQITETYEDPPEEKVG